MSGREGMSAIRADGLRKVFGSKVAVDSVSFEVPRGEVFGFLGPNGAGKTTTLRMLLGLIPRTGGSAQVLGLDPAREAPRLRSSLGYVSQLHSLYADLSVAENLRFFARIYGLNGRDALSAIERVVDKFGLAESLSGRVAAQPTGVRRRAALAAALLHDPELLILDEPTSGMDPGSRRRLWSFLGGLVDEGKTVVVTTHHLEEVEACDRVALMLSGRLVFTGGPQEMRSSYGESVLEVRAAEWDRAFVLLKGWYGASLAGRAVRVDPRRARSEEIHSRLAEEGLSDVRVEQKTPSLEDAFVRLAEQELANERE
ncbi:MAG: hypothetical protein Kow00129_11740 [Thermoleophilia bacterium]